MSNSNTEINIIKILNLPIENENHAEVNCDFPIELSNNFQHIMIKDGSKLQSKNDFIAQIENGNIKSHEVYPSCPFLWAIDDMGEKYTIYNFSYVYIDNVYRHYIKFWFDGIIKGGHLQEELQNQKFDRIETEVEYKTQIRRIESTCNSIRSVIEPVFIRDENLSKFLGDSESNSCWFDNKLKITLDGKTTFEEIKKRLWRLSEFAFLCYEDMFFYDTLSVFIGENSYILKHFLQANDSKSRNMSLRTEDVTCNRFSKNAFNENNFASFLKFRTDSDFIFDVFRTAVYSDTFREDYPLRLSQTLEGLADYLRINKNKEDKEKYTAIAKEKNERPSNFEIAISSALTTAKDIFYPFSKDFTQEIFCKKIKDHRHKFSHVKATGNYLQGNENEKFAEILYTTVRVLIIKQIKGEI